MTWPSWPGRRYATAQTSSASPAETGRRRWWREYRDDKTGTTLDLLPDLLKEHGGPRLRVRIGDKVLQPYARYRACHCADLDPVLRAPGLTALGLNSMPRWRWKSGRVTRRQTVAVVETLGGGAADTVRLLALHHPPFVGGLARLVGRGRLVRALVEARVDLVLSGHTHVPEARAVELATGGRGHRVVQVVAGTATSLRTRGHGRSWSLIRVDAEAVLVRERYQVDGGWRTGRTVRFSRRP